MSGLPDYADALRMALSTVDASVIQRIGVEDVRLADAADRVLAQTIVADRDLPPFNRAMMDGYALRAAEILGGRAFPVVGEVPAGASGEIRVPVGACVKIATGAPVPDGCDAVIQHEVSDRGNPVRFSIERIEPGHAVHRRASDARQGAALIPAGTIIASHHLGIAAAVGAQSLHVRRRPRAAILTSGDEVVPAGIPTAGLAPHQIRNSNGVMVSELLRRFGTDEPRTHHVRDQLDATLDAVKLAMESSDVVITVGGVSAGERDHFPAAFDAMSVRRTLHGAAIQPGRPIVVGRSNDGVIVIALPGNPVSSLACACLFAWPIIRAMRGISAPLDWRDIALAEPVQPNAHRRAFRPAVVGPDGKATVPMWAGSGDLAHTAPTHGLVELPVQTQTVPAGTGLRFLAWP